MSCSGSAIARGTADTETAATRPAVIVRRNILLTPVPVMANSPARYLPGEAANTHTPRPVHEERPERVPLINNHSLLRATASPPRRPALPIHRVVTARETGMTRL